MHSSVNDLLQDITAPTVERQPQSTSTAEIVPVSPTPTPGPELITGAQENTVTQPGTTDSQQIPQNTQKPEPVKQPVSEEMIATGADIAIGMFDFGQQNIFKFFVKKKKERKLEKINPSWVVELDELIKEVEQGSVQVKNLKKEQLSMLKIEKGTREILENLPLSEEEKKQLRVPLMEIMRQNGGVIPANIQLMLGVLMIAGGRAADVYML